MAEKPETTVGKEETIAEKALRILAEEAKNGNVSSLQTGYVAVFMNPEMNIPFDQIREDLAIWNEIKTGSISFKNKKKK